MLRTDTTLLAIRSAPNDSWLSPPPHVALSDLPSFFGFTRQSSCFLSLVDCCKTPFRTAKRLKTLQRQAYSTMSAQPGPSKKAVHVKVRTQPVERSHSEDNSIQFVFGHNSQDDQVTRPTQGKRGKRSSSRQPDRRDVKLRHVDISYCRWICTFLTLALFL